MPRLVPALTDAKVRNAKPKDKPYRLFDGQGLYLEVAPSGGRWWRFKYRFEGKEKRLALGAYPAVLLGAARQKRDAARALLARKIDPGENRKAVKAAERGKAINSFEVVAREWFGKQKDWTAGHAETVLRRLEQRMFPWLGARPIDEIQAAEILAVIRRIEEQGKIETAHRVKVIAGQVFRYAIATGRAERDPSADLRGALEKRKPVRMAAPTEVKDVGPLLVMLDAYEGTFTVKCALRLAPLVFVRPGELRQARWADIDLAAAEWRYRASKTDTPHIVPLARQAVAVLEELKPATFDSVYVFPSLRTKDRPMSDGAVNAALRRLGIGKDVLCGHGFRAMARTILDEVLGVRPVFIELQLAHKVTGPLGDIYNRATHLEERRAMMQKWADFLDELRTHHASKREAINSDKEEA